MVRWFGSLLCIGGRITGESPFWNGMTKHRKRFHPDYKSHIDNRPTALTSSLLKYLHSLVLPSQHCLGIHTEPLIQDRRIDAAKVDRVDQVSIFQLGQARVFAHDS